MRALNLKTDRPVVILCPGAEFGAAKRWPPNQFADLAALFLRDGLQVWIVGSPNDKIASEAVLMSMGDDAAQACATSPAAPTSARPSTSCRRRRSSSATTRA